jgi:hypothetical protein
MIICVELLKAACSHGVHFVFQIAAVFEGHIRRQYVGVPNKADRRSTARMVSLSTGPSVYPYIRRFHDRQGNRGGASSAGCRKRDRVGPVGSGVCHRWTGRARKAAGRRRTLRPGGCSERISELGGLTYTKTRSSTVGRNCRHGLRRNRGVRAGTGRGRGASGSPRRARSTSRPSCASGSRRPSRPP